MEDEGKTDMDVRSAVMSCLTYWQQNHANHKDSSAIRTVNKSDEEKLPTSVSGMRLPLTNENIAVTTESVHTKCSIIQIMPSQEQEMKSIVKTSYETFNGTLYHLPQEVNFDIVSIRLLQTISIDETSSPNTISSSYRAASVQITMSCCQQIQQQQPQSSSSAVAPFVTGWMVLLKNHKEQWQCISGAFYVEERKEKRNLLNIQPSDISDVITCVWDGYCTANRACDGIQMAQVFHPTCRLTYVDRFPIKGSDVYNHKNDMDDGIRVVSSEAFCYKVTNRYMVEAPHIPFAHIRTEPIVATGDEILGIEFAVHTPYIAMVTLKVGHPPFLWTDLLTCARLDDAKWYIVHKSSTSEPFLTHLAKETITKSMK